MIFDFQQETEALNGQVSFIELESAYKLRSSNLNPNSALENAESIKKLQLTLVRCKKQCIIIYINQFVLFESM